MKLKKIKKRLRALEEHSHEPQEIAPRIHTELERMRILAELFQDVPTVYLKEVAYKGLENIK